MRNNATMALGAALALAAPSCAGGGGRAALEQGALWRDTDGRQINAHGGGILAVGGTFYWYGEMRRGTDADGARTETDRGVSCYSSTDLLNWRPEGVALAVAGGEGDDLEPGCIVERPKVARCAKTGRYVMWFHLELKGQGYAAARYGVAVADRPQGPFRLVRTGRANPGVWPVGMAEADKDTAAYAPGLEWWTPEWADAVRRGMYAARDMEGGQMCRDMTLFVDDDGKAYHVYASEENLTLHIAGLTDDYTAHSGRYARVAPGGHNEAPALFKHGGRYWMIASGCTGWEPNEARLLVADSVWGPWSVLPNPCRGPEADVTFRAQSSFVLPVGGGRLLAMFDRWRPDNLLDSRHVWLPVSFSDDGTPVVEWRDSLTAADLAWR